jgi:hypothetical protein
VTRSLEEHQHELQALLTKLDEQQYLYNRTAIEQVKVFASRYELVLLGLRDINERAVTALYAGLEGINKQLDDCANQATKGENIRLFVDAINNLRMDMHELMMLLRNYRDADCND